METVERVAHQIDRIVQSRIAAGRLVLPAVSATTARIIALLKDADLSLKQVAMLLERDPVVAAQVLRLANSAAFATGAPARSIEQAVTRLGATKLRTLLVEVTARPLMQSSNPRIADACRNLWEHSLAVALLARDVAALVHAPEGDTTYLVGLLHDVGKPIVATLLLEAERAITNGGKTAWIEHGDFVDVVQRTHRGIGIALAEKWQLPDCVAAGIRDCGDYDADDRQSPANLVRFANAVVKREGIYVGKFDAEDADALVMIGRSLLGIEEDVIARLGKGLHDRVKAQG